MVNITVPQMDANIIDVTVTRWRKNAGDDVAKGECVAEVTTDKAVYELSAPEAGCLLAIFAQPKSVVPVGYIVGIIGEKGAVPPPEPAENAALMTAYQDPAAVAARVARRAHAPRVRATPRARRIAAEKGLDLAKIQAATGAKIIDESVLQQYLETKQP